ncbi:hypothetical protein QBC45DRAFT_309653, partial [Copromyces sp. CBS 386.78]
MLLDACQDHSAQMPRHHPHRPDIKLLRRKSRRFRICENLYNICRMPSFCNFPFPHRCTHDTDKT